jgi:hypothetical protein
MNIKESNDRIFDLLELNMRTGPWLAGRMASKVWMNEPPDYSDWDIWCSSVDQMTGVARRLSANNYSILAETDNAITYSNGSYNQEWDPNASNVVIQVIVRDIFKHPYDIIDRFDFSVCQVVTDGNEFIFGKYTKYDLRHHVLRYVRDSDPIKGTIGRIIKYITYGYKPNASISQLIEDCKECNIEWGNQSNEYGEL